MPLSDTPRLVWLTEERTFGELVSMGAFYSRVRYFKEGIDYEVYIENDEFEEIWEDDGFDHEEDDE